MSNCPLGYQEMCTPKYPKARGCKNYDRCDRQMRLAISLPYYYSHERKCLQVYGVYRQVFYHYHRNHPDHFQIENHHPLRDRTAEELESLGFASAIPNPKFDSEIYNRHNPPPPPDPDDDGIPF
jgi:hypothetical protein